MRESNLAKLKDARLENEKIKKELALTHGSLRNEMNKTEYLTRDLAKEKDHSSALERRIDVDKITHAEQMDLLINSKRTLINRCNKQTEEIVQLQNINRILREALKMVL